MEMTPRKLAAAISLAGGALAAVGVGLIYLPAGMIVAGVGLVAFGLLAVDVKAERGDQT